MVIRRPSDIAVLEARGTRWWLRQGAAIEAVLQDRFNTLIGTRADGEGTATGRFQPLGAGAFPQPHKAYTGTEALLGMDPRGENRFHHLRTVTVLWRPLKGERWWLATRCPLWKISTTRALTRTSSCCLTSA